MIVLYYLVHGVIFCGLAYWLYRSHRDPLFWPGLVFKIICGAGVGLLYLWHYNGGDTLLFFDDAIFLSRQAIQSPGEYVRFLWDERGSPWLAELTYSQYRSLFFVKAISLVALFTFQQYWLVAAWCSFLSFLGCWLLYRTLGSLWPEGRLAAAISLLFFPSFVFWSAGVIKESLAVAGLMVISAVLLRALAGKAHKAEVLLFVVSAWLVWALKYYWLAVWLPVAVSLVVHQIWKARSRTAGHTVVALAASLVVLVGVIQLHPNFDLGYLPTVIVENNRAYTASGGADHAFAFADLEANWGSILVHAPWAAFSGIFRPLPGESVNFLSLVFSLENGIVLLLALWALVRWVRIRELNSWMMAVILYSLSLAAFLALSTPNFGSLARYKTGFIPFLVCLILFQHPVVRRLQTRVKFP